MKKLIVKSLLFLLLTGIIIVLVAMTYEPNTDLEKNYQASIIDKHARADTLSSPKVIFVGGSNLAFGIDCQRIEKEIGLHAQNMAQHAGLGLIFMLNEAMDVSKNGDIIVLAPEYFLDIEGQPDLLELACLIFPRAKDYTQHDLFYYSTVYFTDFQKKFNVVLGNTWVRPFDSSSVYTRNAFNKWGDVVKHLDMGQPETIANRETYPNQDWTGVELLNNFNNEAKKKGIRVLYTFPAYPESEYLKNKDVVDSYNNHLNSTLKIQILGCPTDFVFSDSLFFDSVYHLRRHGRDLRTAKIIELLKTALGVATPK